MKKAAAQPQRLPDLRAQRRPGHRDQVSPRPVSIRAIVYPVSAFANVTRSSTPSSTAGPSTQARLAAATGFEPPTVTLSIRQLEDAGLVIRRPSPTDRRATVVELSDQGRTLLPELKAAWCRLAEQTMAGFTSIPLDQLTDVLADLAASLDASHGPATGDPFNEPAPAIPRNIARSASRRRPPAAR